MCIRDRRKAILLAEHAKSFYTALIGSTNDSMRYDHILHIENKVLNIAKVKSAQDKKIGEAIMKRNMTPFLILMRTIMEKHDADVKET